MVKLFISQPMKGKTDEEILAVRGKGNCQRKGKFPRRGGSGSY